MRSRIVMKLFLLTTLLCSLILGALYVGQTAFFKRYYVSEKLKAIQESLQVYKNRLESYRGDTARIQSIEQEFYRDHGAWLAVLDRNGEPIPSGMFEIEVIGESLEGRSVRYRVPLYHLIGAEEGTDFERFLTDQTSFWLYGIAKENTFIPAAIREDNGGLGFRADTFANERLKRIMDGIVAGKLQSEPDFSGSKAALYDPFTYLRAKVVKSNLPVLEDKTSLVYTNELFLDRINIFQTELLMNGDMSSSKLSMADFEQNELKFKLMIEPMSGADGNPAYLFAMTSLQPVDEAVRTIRDYFVYMIAFVFFLVLLASYYYAVSIARPILRVNQMTKKLADLDFAAAIPIRSKDEIGDLSRNINALSQRLQAYIGRLQDDIEKEKRLENTRKTFIADVSHELKTPLSVMKSCVSILKDGVAIHKRDYYFAALDREVNRMDELIVGMLELAKYESGTYRFNMELFYLDRVIEAVGEQFASRLRERQLHLHIGTFPVQVVGNPIRIEQVLTNFVSNAIRHTPEGRSIRITAAEDKNRVEVRVENEGIAIPDDQLDKIWDRFYRGDVSRPREDGSGLGLAISKNILELHDAEYGATNTSNGVAFYFYLRKLNGSGDPTWERGG